jgi:hypothetical protein
MTSEHHGNVAGRSAGGGQTHAATRHHSRAPLARRFRGARAEQFAEIADLLARFRQMGFKSAWLPHLELLAEADKSDVRSDAGVLLSRSGRMVRPS